MRANMTEWERDVPNRSVLGSRPIFGARVRRIRGNAAYCLGFFRQPRPGAGLASWLLLLANRRCAATGGSRLAFVLTRASDPTMSWPLGSGYAPQRTPPAAASTRREATVGHGPDRAVGGGRRADPREPCHHVHHEQDADGQATSAVTGRMVAGRQRRS